MAVAVTVTVVIVTAAAPPTTARWGAAVASPRVSCSGPKSPSHRAPRDAVSTMARPREAASPDVKGEAVARRPVPSTAARARPGCGPEKRRKRGLLRFVSVKPSGHRGRRPRNSDTVVHDVLRSIAGARGVSTGAEARWRQTGLPPSRTALQRFGEPRRQLVRAMPCRPLGKRCETRDRG